MPILDRFRNIWNAFSSPPPESPAALSYGTTATYGGGSPSRPALRVTNERSIVSSVYTRLSVDVAGNEVRHVKTDDDARYAEDMNTSLNDCLTIEPNMDQGPRAFRQDIALTLFDKGVACIVPVDTSENPDKDGKFDIYSLRVGEIVEWFPSDVRVNLYNEKKGVREQIRIPKRSVAIVENPLYEVMNQPNSTLQRLGRKLHLLDAVDEQSGSGRLDIIIQLPYAIKSEARQQQAEKRREDIEFQLRGSQYGIAYTDGTEKITQLNRPSENNLLKQVEYLTNLLYNQLGLTEEVMNGTADEATMLNYFNRTIEPIMDAIVEAMRRSFLGVLGIKRNEQIMYFRDPFKFVPVGQIAEIGDKFVRNEIATSNELRGFIGMKPSKDPKADELRNSNMPQKDTEATSTVTTPLERNHQNGSRLQRVGDEGGA